MSRRRSRRTTLLWVAVLTVSSLAIVPVATGAGASSGDPRKSGPPDTSNPSRAAIPNDASKAKVAGTANVVDPIVSNTDPTLKNGAAGGTEPGAAGNPVNPRQFVVDGFNGGWGANAPVFTTADGGATWSRNLSVPVPTGRAAQAAGCPCDQTFDYDSTGLLYGSFLLGGSTGTIVTGSTTDPTSAAAWQWRGNPAQFTDNAVNHDDDQPWMLANADPVTAGQSNVYVGYDDFTGGNSRVAVSLGAAPPNFTRDAVMRNFGGAQASNPGTRLAKGPNGVMWGIDGETTSTVLPKAGHYQINQSTDGGTTWATRAIINANYDDNPNSTNTKFGTVNALLGSVEAIAVDPVDPNIVYIAFGVDVGGGANTNQIQLVRFNQNTPAFDRPVVLASTGAAANDAALPGVAVTADGSIFVLYTTHDGTSGGFPQFSAHLHKFTDNGATFVDGGDQVLEQFLSPSINNGDPRQRVLGDYQQIKAVGNTVYGAFPGNRVPLNGNAGLSVIDPIFFSLRTVLLASSTRVSGNPNPSSSGQSVTITAQVTGQPGQPNPTGTVSFFDGASFLGTGTVNPATGQATLTTSFTTPPPTHPITATYNGDGNYGPSSGTYNQLLCAADHTITGSQPKSLTLNGGAWCVSNANVSGSIVVAKATGTTVSIVNSTVSGGISAGSDGAFTLCGSSVGGSGVTISGASGFVLIGDPVDDSCAANNVQSVSLTSNTAGVELTQNTVTNNVAVFSNSGHGPFAEDSAPEIEGNHIGGSLSCSGNVPTPTNDGQPNTAASRSGQCVGL